MTVTAAWVLWLISGMTFIISTRNPIYLLITILMLYLLGFRIAKDQKSGQWVKLNFRFLLTIAGLSALINMIFTHAGKTVLFSLPADWILIGGPITLESLVYGVINGLVINTLYLLFNIFNKALSVKQITRLIPRAFHPIATIVTISLTFFPSIQQRIQEIREAQLIRGNPMKKIADWLPVIIPLLVSSLEDAFLLSESMTSRGFHTRTDAKYSSINLVLLILSVFAVFAGWVFNLYDYPKLLSIVLYIFAALIVIAVIFIGHRHNPIKSYRREIWQTSDITATVFFSFSLIILLILLLTENLPSLAYTTYPRLSWPEFNWIGLLLSLLPGLPLLFFNHD